MANHEFTFYEYAQLNLGFDAKLINDRKMEVVGQGVNSTVKPGTGSSITRTALNPVTPVKVQLTDDDPFLQDDGDPVVIGEKDTGTPQKLTANVLKNGGGAYASNGGNVFALGQGTVTNNTTGQTGFYMMVGGEGNPNTSWGLTSSIQIRPGDSVTYGPINYLVNNLAYEVIDNPIVCFTSGTRLETNRGLVAVEDLQAGDMLLTHDGSYQPLRWIWSTPVSAERILVNEKLAPVVIRAGALGKGLPHRDLRVSRQHRMLISSPIAKATLGVGTVLVSAIKLTVLPGVEIDRSGCDVRYFHLVFDEHLVIRSEGAWSESLLLGPQSLKSLSEEALTELRALFPAQLKELSSAFPIPTGKEQKRLIASHLETGVVLAS